MYLCDFGLVFCLYSKSLPLEPVTWLFPGIDIAALAEISYKIQLGNERRAVEPKVFHTDNPARIALIFSGVKNALIKNVSGKPGGGDQYLCGGSSG